MKYLKRFNDIDEEYVLSDKHIHSTWTDGEGSVLDLVEEAKKKGLNTIAITDHIRSTSTYFDDYKKEIEEIDDKEDLNVLAAFHNYPSNL